MKRAAALTFSILFMSCGGSESASRAPNVSTTQAKTMPEMLAGIDFANPDEITVNRYASLLRQLDSVYEEDEQHIGDMSTVAMQLLAKEGVRESILNIMDGLNTVSKVIPPGTQNQKYAEYASMYLKLRAEGQNHEQAVRGLRGVLAAILGVK